jgi:predicted GNAT family acetyltransferase
MSVPASESSSASAPDEIVVRHNAAAHRFETTVGEFLAVAEYELTDGDGTVVFTHTFVPGELRGRGLAEKLVRPALEWARGERRRVVPACSYVARFIERHAEFQSLVR